MVGEDRYDYGEVEYCFSYPVLGLGGAAPLVRPASDARNHPGPDFTSKAIVLIQAEWYPPEQLIAKESSGFGTAVLLGKPKPTEETLVWAETLHPENVFRVPVDVAGIDRHRQTAACAVIDLDHRHS